MGVQGKRGTKANDTKNRRGVMQQARTGHSMQRHQQTNSKDKLAAATNSQLRKTEVAISSQNRLLQQHRAKKNRVLHQQHCLKLGVSHHIENQCHSFPQVHLEMLLVSDMTRLFAKSLSAMWLNHCGIREEEEEVTFLLDSHMVDVSM